MVPGKRTNKILQIAETVIRTEAALGELHLYYRFGRHHSPFSQKLYFLFSHCAHLLFSLWLDEQDSPNKVFTGSPGLTALFDQVDFGSLRYLDYSRRMLYANAYEEHLKNEPKWFKFWVKLLQGLQGADVAGSEEFTRQFFACLADRSMLERQLARREKKTLATLVQGPRAGRLLLHSIWVLEDVVSTASAHIAQHDPMACAIEQMQSLICLLSQLRRGIVWETTPRGPYTLSAYGGWHETSALDRLWGRRVSGILTVTPTQGSGEIICKHERTVDSRAHERTWVRSIAALPCAYEELLFKTWPLDMREQPSNCQTPAPGQAQWIVQAVEAGHLEAISKHVDKLLEALGRHPAYGGLVEAVAHVLRNGRSEWTCGELPWDYLRKLDQLISKLKFACREAKVLGGKHPAEKVVANLWPVQATTRQEADTTVHDTLSPPTDVTRPAEEIGVSDVPRTEDSPTPKCRARMEEETPGVCDVRKREPDTGSQAPPIRTEASEPTNEPAVADPVSESCLPPTDLADKVELADIESLLQPECFKARDRADQKPVPSERHKEKPKTDRLEQVISLIVNGDDGSSEPFLASDARQSLVWRLLEWHRPAAEGVDREPLSLLQLQRDLGWSQSHVLQEMSDLFGSKPFTLYRQKCLDKGIHSFLETCRVHHRKGIETNAQTPSLSIR